MAIGCGSFGEKRGGRLAHFGGEKMRSFRCFVFFCQIFLVEEAGVFVAFLFLVFQNLMSQTWSTYLYVIYTLFPGFQTAWRLKRMVALEDVFFFLLSQLGCWCSSRPKLTETPGSADDDDDDDDDDLT